MAAYVVAPDFHSGELDWRVVRIEPETYDPTGRVPVSHVVTPLPGRYATKAEAQAEADRLNAGGVAADDATAGV